MDAGTIWYEALSQAGRNIADGIEHYKQQHDQIDSMDQTVQMLSQQSFPDPTGKRDKKTGQIEMKPLITPEMVQQWTAKTNAQKMHSIGAMNALMEYRMGMAHMGAQAMMKEDQMNRLDQILTINGRQFRRDNRGALVPIPPTPEETATAKISAQEKAKKKRFEDVFTNPASVEKGFKDDKGAFQTSEGLRKEGKADKAAHKKQWVRVVDQQGKSMVMPLATWKAKRGKTNVGATSDETGDDPDTIKSDYKAGKISKEEAIKRLRKHGYQ